MIIGRLSCLLFALVATGQTPAVTLSTYLGLADCDAVTMSGHDAFLACHSTDGDFPVAVQGAPLVPGEMNAYVIRLNPTTGQLVYVTRFGGHGYTGAFRIRIEEATGAAWVTGVTKAPDFPVTSDALQRQYGGGDGDAFVVKLSAAGQIVYSTFLGGKGADFGNGLELDRGGRVLFVAGTTTSENFPAQSRKTTSDADVFVCRLQQAALRCTTFGGGQEEKLTGLVRTPKGDALFAVGYTKSSAFPTVNAVQAQLRGPSDLFLTRLAASTLALTFSTFFGGSGDDSGWGIAVDHNGDPVVAGITGSPDLPVSRTAMQSSLRGDKDTFVARFSGRRYATVHATYYGGSADDESGYDGEPLQLDRAGNVWLGGITSSTDLPLRSPVQPRFAGGDTDGYLALFTSDLSKLCFATYRGGSGRDLLEGLALSEDGMVLATGVTFSSDLPLSAAAIRTKPSGVVIGGRIASNHLYGMRPAPVCD